VGQHYNLSPRRKGIKIQNDGKPLVLLRGNPCLDEIILGILCGFIGHFKESIIAEVQSLHANYTATN